MERFTTRPELRGTFGMVASTHWLASAAGMSMLERGGNAFDAAVAAGFVLQVVEPHLNGPGGEVPILLYSAERDEVLVVDGQGTGAGRGDDRALPRARARARAGHRAAGGRACRARSTPGCCSCASSGRCRWRRCWSRRSATRETATRSCRGSARTIARMEQVFRDEWPGSAELYLPVPKPGTLFRNRDLAATYRRVLAESDARGRSTPPRRLLPRLRRRGDRRVLARARRLLTGDDLASWHASVEQPVTRRYAGWDVHKTGPWGQGPVFLQQLALLEGFELGDRARAPSFVHTVVECAKLAFADREAWYGDGDVPLDDLLSAGVRGRAPRARRREASGELRPGSPAAASRGSRRIPDAQARARRPASRPAATPATSTWPTASATSSRPRRAAAGCRARRSIPGLGFCLGHAGADVLARGGPAELARAAASGRARRSRRRSRCRDGETLAFGTPGGDQQDQWSLVFFLTLVHFGLNLQEAIDAPMFHTEHFPSSFYPRQPRPRALQLESRFAGATIDELRRRGHDVELARPWSLGRLSAAGRDREGLLYAAANPRGMQGYAVGR